MASDPRWAEIRALFEEALELAPDEREAFLAARCASDAEMRAEVEALLAGVVDDDFLDSDVADQAAVALHEALPDPLGMRVGPFRLTERLGEGGMGQVFVGERADGGFEQRVAVKLIGSVYATPSLLRRFERERSILASLNHPNIAHLMDGGVSALGPYLAMELVEDASTLLEHCDARRLTIRERVELFITMCDAVHTAHQQLIVHRDLKPSNVLVTADGRVKLLDFGIAALLDGGAGGRQPITRTGFRMMTPEYASPEQLRGSTVSTASDLYSLGVMLFELLSGHRPYDLRDLSPAEVERRVLETSPTRPSDAVGRVGVAAGTGRPATPDDVGAARSERPDRLRRALRGDLDTIVHKAMHRDPARRYASAAALAEDLRRHLDRLPVRARPDTLAYRLSTFARRNRGGVAAAGLVLTAAVVGAGATLLQARRADTRFEETRQLAGSMLTELNQALEDVPGATGVRAMLVSEALSYLDDLSSDPRADRDHLLDVADAYDQIGEIQGDPTNTNLGDLAAARTSYEEGRRIREALWAVDSTDMRTRRSLAESYHKLAIVTAFEGDLQESTRLGQRGLEVLSPLEASRRPGDPVPIAGGRLRTVVGENLVNDGAWDVGPALLDTAVVLLEAAVAQAPDDVRLVTDLWDAYNGQATFLWYTQRAEDGLRLLEDKACPMLRSLLDARPKRASAVYTLHQCHDYRGQMFEQLGRLDEAEASHRRSIELAEELLALESSNETAHEAVGGGHLALGRLLFRMGRADEGRAALGRTITITESLKAQNPSNGRWIFHLATVQRELCRALLANAAPDDALPACKAAVEGHDEAARMGPGVITNVTLAFALGQAARAHRALSDRAPNPDARRLHLDAAVQHYERSVETYALVGDLGEDAAWEIHPDTVAAEWARLRTSGGG